MKTTWFDFFNTFFEETCSEIGEVMYADGCREGWLQGEMFRKSTDENFSVNSYKIMDDNKVTGTIDVYGEKPFENSQTQKMIAEIKIVASSFYTKCIDGNYNIESYSTKGIVKITQKHLDRVNHKEGSILKDMTRLLSIEEMNLQKYIILVIPEYEDITETPGLKKALSNISLSNNCRELKYPEHDFSVRIWKI